MENAAAAAPAPRRRYGGKSAEQRRSERREALVAAALEIWQESGWAAVTMRGVCARAGLTDRYFYESFSDRDALLATLWDQMRDETLAMMLAAIAPHADEGPLDQLHAALSAVVHHIGDEPQRAQIVFGDHAGSAVLEQRRRETIQLAVTLMIDLARPYLRDDIDEVGFRVAVLTGIGGFVETMLAWRSGLIEADTDQLVEHLAAVGAGLAPQFLRG
ncbi:MULTISPECIES: TetR/AcrR family transcriptional regulator [unclassified Nocardioides]|uniref:TetR/AcrR family transcriptional regulator n=1 Tax=unclassified Nocardioides TaxID=2615069 RepID=UPI000702FD99|nr:MULTISPECIES: TetR/AcrR family transcriptional regulator [unclassified Nocardioides]KRC53154.1 TetR family transcriptional regulator [Nocardioides sp. Root79]KRC72682.1 TetR family transcriptional regulator [Nocardioides sp. Root240]